MNVTRTLGAIATIALTLGLGACAGGAQEKASSGHTPALSVTDVAGRTVSFDAQPKRILLAEGRALMATSVLNKENPAKDVVAIGADLHKAAPSFESALRQARPQVSKLPMIGSIAKGDVTVENMLSFKPDAVVMTLDQKEAAEKAGFLQKMDQAKLPHVFIDFRRKPLENTTKSMATLGKIFDGKAISRAKEFNKFYQSKVDDVSRRVSRESDKPRTFLWRAAGLKDCCSTYANLNLGDVITAAGGHNLGRTSSGHLQVTSPQRRLWQLNPNTSLPPVVRGLRIRRNRSRFLTSNLDITSLMTMHRGPWLACSRPRDFPYSRPRRTESCMPSIISSTTLPLMFSHLSSSRHGNIRNNSRVST